MSWSRKEPKWDWKAFLTEEEEALVRDSERQIGHAKHIMALHRPVLAVIQNRAIHRAKYAARLAAPTSARKGG